MGIYEVFLRDERGKDKSAFSLTDEGKVRVKQQLEISAVGLVKEEICVIVALISIFIFFFPAGYQAVMNELFRVIGELHIIQGKNEAAHNKKTTEMIKVCTFTVFGICVHYCSL